MRNDAPNYDDLYESIRQWHDRLREWKRPVSVPDEIRPDASGASGTSTDDTRHDLAMGNERVEDPAPANPAPRARRARKVAAHAPKASRKKPQRLKVVAPEVPPLPVIDALPPKPEGASRRPLGHVFLRPEGFWGARFMWKKKRYYSYAPTKEAVEAKMLARMQAVGVTFDPARCRPRQYKRDARFVAGPMTPRVRYLVMERDGFRCQLCGVTAADGARLEVDHKIPFAKGGTHEMENLWTLCAPCNLGKGTDALTSVP